MMAQVLFFYIFSKKYPHLNAVEFLVLLRFYQSLYLCSPKCISSLTLKHHNFFQNENNRKAAQSFDPRPLLFKLEQEISKFNDICVSWSSPKTDLVSNFLNFKKSKFCERQFLVFHNDNF